VPPDVMLMSFRPTISSLSLVALAQRAVLLAPVALAAALLAGALLAGALLARAGRVPG